MKNYRAVDLYDYIYSWKDYPAEANQIRDICSKYLGRPLTSVLEWACGTGRYLESFSELNCIGVDLCERSLELAARRVPSARLICEDMALFKAESPVDLIFGLFGAIGYLEPKKQLPIALRRAYKTLAPDGLLILEPWVSEEGFVKKQAFLRTFRALNMQIARMVITDQVDMQSVLNFEYLLSISGGKIQRLQSEERLWLSNDAQLLSAIEGAGFQHVDQQIGFMPQSKLWICRK